MVKRFQALQSELDECKEKLRTCEEEAEEMRADLKKLARLQKNEKGHNAMTEELKKMEEETGLSVSVIYCGRRGTFTSVLFLVHGSFYFYRVRYLRYEVFCTLLAT